MIQSPFHSAIKTHRVESVKTGSVAINRLILITLLTAFYCTDTAAEADGPDYWRVTGVAEDDSLNIRAQPNARSAKVGAIPPDGSCIANRGCQGGLSYEQYSTLSKSEQAKRLTKNPRWCRIEYRGLTGWVAGRYLAEGGCP